MGKRLYPRLAAQSLRLNRRFFLPYILSLVGNVAAFYIMSALVTDPGVADMTPGRSNGYYYVQMMMTLGMFVAFVFSVIFVFYINGFLMKQRKRELGLYNILGMGKSHIAALLLLEGLYVGIIGIAGGLAVGLLLHKLVTLLLYRALDFATDARLRKAIREHTGQMTVFIISQRVSAIRDADHILVMDNGRAEGYGTHEELLRGCPIYQEIYASQNAGKEAASHA